jgi:hypothetical protein
MEDAKNHVALPGENEEVTAPVTASPLVDTTPLIRKVQLEGLVVLKIIKHCQENFPMTVMGQLLGMDIDETLEITNCYPFMTPAVNAAAGPEAGESAAAFELVQQQYQRDMMFHVREGKCLEFWYQRGNEMVPGVLLHFEFSQSYSFCSGQPH